MCKGEKGIMKKNWRQKMKKLVAVILIIFCGIREIFHVDPRCFLCHCDGFIKCTSCNILCIGPCFFHW